MISNIKKEFIARVVIKILYSRFLSFPNTSNCNRNAPFHEAFLRAFGGNLENRVQNIPDYITLSSWLHGLNTSLGQTFFESVAHILSYGEKRKFNNCYISQSQNIIIDTIMTELKNGAQQPNLKRENHLIFNNTDNNEDLIIIPNFTVDCFYETDTEVIAIEIKSVRPNSGEIRGEKTKILKAKAALKRRYPEKEILYFLGFPFDPTSSTSIGWDKTRFLNHLIEGSKFCDENEILIADNFWSYLSEEESTMQTIIEIINDIATSSFMENYNSILNISNENFQDIRPLLERWHLFSEIQIFENIDTFSQDQSLLRVFRQEIFKEGKYNDKRIELINYIENANTPTNN